MITKYVLPNISLMQAAKITPGSVGMVRLLVRDVVCIRHVPFRRCRWMMEVHSAFLSLLTLTFDL